jgi:hypothetical protein
MRIAVNCLHRQPPRLDRPASLGGVVTQSRRRIGTDASFCGQLLEPAFGLGQRPERLQRAFIVGEHLVADAQTAAGLGRVERYRDLLDVVPEAARDARVSMGAGVELGARRSALPPAHPRAPRSRRP